MYKTKFKNGDLFKDTSYNSQNLIITKNGFRIDLTINELLQKEREKGDLDIVLENVEDEFNSI